MKIRTNLMCTTALAAFAFTIPGTAQDASPSADDYTNLEEIVVTARKKSENMQEAPLSISALTAAAIERQNIVSVDEIAKRTAGLSLDPEFGREDDRPVIRGQSNILGNSGVAYFIDGAYITGSLLDYDLDEVERIEVVKGPQSALYGRNTYAGAINIITKSPTDEFTGKFKAGYSSFNTKEFAASLRGPISDNVSGSISGRYYKSDSDHENTLTREGIGGMETKSVSAALYFTPSDKLDIRMRAHYIDTDDEHQAISNTDASENNCYNDSGVLYHGGGAYYCGELLDRAIAIDTDRSLGEAGHRDREKWQTNLTINYAFNDKLSLKSITAYNREIGHDAFDGDYQASSFSPIAVTLAPIFPNGFIPPSTLTWMYLHGIVPNGNNFSGVTGWRTKDAAQEYIFTYSSENTEVRLGGYYFNQVSRIYGEQGFDNVTFAQAAGESYAYLVDRVDAYCAAGGGLPDQTCGGVMHSFFGPPFFSMTIDNGPSFNDSTSEALFGSIEHTAGDFTVTLEGRYSWEKRTRTDIDMPVNFTQFSLVGTAGATSVTVDAFQTSHFNPRFSVAYKASNEVNFYGVYAEGTKSGGVNGASAANVGLGSYGDEITKSFELGMKGDFYDDQLRLNVAVFNNTMNGYQLTEAFFDPVANSTGSAIRNSGKVRIRGIEFETTLISNAVPGLVIDANFAYTDSEILAGTDIHQARLAMIDMTGYGYGLFGATDFGALCAAGGPAGVCGATVPNNEDLQSMYGSIVGNQLPRQAKYQAFIGANYSMAISNAWDVSFGLNWTYESKRFVQVHNLAYLGASNLVNANIAFSNDDLTINLWAKNLTDEDSIIGAFRFVDARTFQRTFAVSPRLGTSYGLTASLKF